MTEERKGMLLVISGPSGAGKGTLLSKLLEEDPSFRFSVSAATRAPRPGEVDGVHYHFMTEEAFVDLIGKDAFLEHAQVHGNRYGTLRSEVYAHMKAGQNVLLDIDVQGGANVMAREPECVSIFIAPPSLKELRARLEGRGTETKEQIDRRVANAAGELDRMNAYQYIVVNDDLETAYQTLKAIVQAEKHRSNRYHPVPDR